jgi:hypothetical protein
LEDFYFDKNVTHIQAIYFGYEQDKLFFMFPGGTLTGGNFGSYDPTKRPWY